jgi:AcrR family transcriptional regulator
MARIFVQLDDIILSVSRELFLTVGIRKTEMKDIAREANIGRSTLYRHFTNKEQIAFYIAKDILIELLAQAKRPTDFEQLTGYEKLEYGLKEYINTLLNSQEKVRLLDEFDQLFTDSYPASEEALEYVEFNKNRDTDLFRFLAEGMKDGSIKYIEDPIFEADVFLNIILGLSQRIIPRAKHYLEEHGYYNEFLEEAVRLLLASVKAHSYNNI